MSTQREQLQKILDLAAKHRERADDRETGAGVAAQQARAKELDAARHRARLDALLYAVGLIREIAEEWTKAADEFIACGDSVSVTAGQTFQHGVRRLDDLAFQLLSEGDGS